MELHGLDQVDRTAETDDVRPRGIRAGRMLSAPGPLGLFSPLLHPCDHSDRTGRQPVVVRGVPDLPSENAKFQLLPGGVGDGRLRLPGDAAHGVAEQQHRRAGVQQGRLVPRPRLRQFRLQFPERVADRRVHRGALHRRAVSPAQTAHVHRGACQSHRALSDGRRAPDALLLVRYGRHGARAGRHGSVRHAGGLPRGHEDNKHHRFAAYLNRTSGTDHRYEHHDHEELDTVQPQVQASRSRND